MNHVLIGKVAHDPIPDVQKGTVHVALMVRTRKHGLRRDVFHCVPIILRHWPEKARNQLHRGVLMAIQARRSPHNGLVVAAYPQVQIL